MLGSNRGDMQTVVLEEPPESVEESLNEASEDVIEGGVLAVDIETISLVPESENRSQQFQSREPTLHRCRLHTGTWDAGAVGSTIFNQRENPAVHGGRESRPFRDATAASGTAGTPTETAKSSANVCFDRVTPHPIANERGMWAALHPCLRRAGSPVDGLWPTRCEPCRHRTARFDRLGERSVENRPR